MHKGERFTKGIDEFNSGLFFECHDTLEEIWNEERNPELKKFYHGLIHITVGFYHLTNHNFRGASSQFKKAIYKLGTYPRVYMDIKLEELLNEVKFWLEKAERAMNGEVENLNLENLPKIKSIDEK
jgi:predicted metal-dependent hydrolase